LTGFRVLFQLRQAASTIPIVMLLDSDDRDLVIDAFRGGAKGVFSRQNPILCRFPQRLDDSTIDRKFVEPDNRQLEILISRRHRRGWWS
jgi:DNA-binding NarL/FixJ family response regulator